MRGFKHVYHLSTKRLKSQQTGIRLLETVSYIEENVHKCSCFIKSKKATKIRNQYNQVPQSDKNN